MAESILFGTAEKFLGDIATASFREIVSAWNAEKDLKKLESTLSTIKSVLLDAEQQQSKNNEVKDWLNKLNHVFYELDNLFDDFSTEALRKELRRKENKKAIKQVCYSILHAKKKIGFSFKMSHKIKAIREEMDMIASDKARFHLKENVEDRSNGSKEREQSHSYVCASNIIGRDNDKKAILEVLMDNLRGENNVSVVPVVGIGGLGKTTLAQLVYNDDEIENWFELKMWVCVSDVFDVKSLIEKIIKSMNEECENLEMDQLQSRLRKCLDGKRYLLVLDDVWNENGEKWKKLEELLMGGSKGSKILVTTRSEKVALLMGTVPAYYLKGLSKDDCWSLFKQLAFKQGNLEGNQRLVKIGNEILEKCGGVPLAVRTVGSLLSLKDTEVDWLIVKNELWELAQDDNYILPSLKVSYDHLPSHLRKCFAYCSLLEKDTFIDRGKLIKLWMAQGLVHSSGKGQQLEDIGDQYFKDLLFRSFFQEVEKDEYGNIKGCKMHDLIHDLAQSVAGIECSRINANTGSISGETYHVSFDSQIKPSWEVPAFFLRAKKVRTLLFCGAFGPQIRSTHDTLISHFMCVRVLDLHYSEIKNVPDSVGKLNHLRYLDLSRNSSLSMLPLSICNLQNLQTLKLSNCFRLEELPIDIRKLVSLRHLENDRCDELTHMPFGLGDLISLRTLQLFVVGKQGSFSKSIGGIGELKGLNHLRGTLTIARLENVRYGTLGPKEAREANLKAKQWLQVLSLEWNQDGDGDEDADAIAAVLQDLEPPPNLKELNVKGYGGRKFPSWMMLNVASCLPHLVQINLYDCKRCRNLPSFGQLPFLKVLKLSYLSSLEFIDNNTFGSFSFFPSLEKLELYELPLLKEWSREAVLGNADKVSSLSFPLLAHLDIHGCANLVSMPFTPSIELLRITYICEKLLCSMTIGPEPNIQMTKLASSLPISPLSNLKTLSICFCEDLVSLPEGFQNLTSLQDLQITQCHKLVQLPEEGLRGLRSLRFLHFNFCNSLTSLSRGIKYLTALEKLEIFNCPTFDWLEEEDGFKGLGSLQYLDISMLEVVRLPRGLQELTALQTLSISCNNLLTLPEWIGNLTSLEKLRIAACHSLESLPNTLSSLTSLKELTITFCDLLSERCQKEGGTEWSKIAHIPKIEIL